MAIKLLLYEDNAKLRHSLSQLLNEKAGFNVAGAFPDCDNVEEQVLTLEPAIVVMDIDMPGIGGIQGSKIIKSVLPAVKIIIHTVFDDDNRIFECICAGADGYLLKNTPPVKLVQALLELAEGGAPMSPFVAQRIFTHFRKESAIAESFQLTNREKEILEMLVKGNSYKMIADKCLIGINTVKKHLQNIYHKLHVNCGTEAVAIALQNKIVKLD